jgi:hypothetical protein
MRLEISVVNRMLFPSGDHDAPASERVKYKSSMGTGRAFGFDSDVKLLPSVIGRLSGPDGDC